MAGTDLLNDPLLRDAPVVEGFKVLAPCALYAVVGQGGMGVVYRGRHLNLDIDVAVKCMRPGLVEVDPDAVTRFQREARIAARIHHQNLVHVYDVSSQGGLHYLVMEFVQGETARARVQRKGALREREAATIVLGAARGLAEAHAARIVHRDIKPDNVLVSADGRVKVSDLGIAKAIDSGEGTALTRGVMGTPQYMSPEQWTDTAGVGVQSDVWSLGAVLWYLLAGGDAIPRGTIQESYLKVCVQPFPDLRERKPGTSPELLAILDRCLKKKPEERYASAGQLAEALEEFLGDADNLGDSDTGTLKAPETLVSPPPAGTLAKIRVSVARQEGAGTVAPTIPFPTAAGATAAGARAPAAGGTSVGAGAPPGSSPALTIPLPQSRKALGIAALVLVVLGGLLAWALTGPSRSSGGSEGPRFKRNWIGAIRVDGKTVAIDNNGRGEVRVAKARVGIEADLVDDEIESVGLTVGNRQGVNVEVDDERIAREVDLGKGSTSIELGVAGAGTLEYRVDVVLDTEAPALEILRPASGTVVAQADLGLGVRAVDDALLEVVSDGRSLAAARREGEYDGTVRLKEGPNRIVVVATDAAGNRSETSVDVVLDTQGPVVRLVGPSGDATLRAGDRVELQFEFSEPVKSFNVAGIEVALAPDARRASFERAVPAAPGKSSWKLDYAARDAVGNATTDAVTWKVSPLEKALVPEGWEALDGEYGSEGWARKVRDPASGITFVLIEAGTFQMGSPGKGGVPPDEQPAHVVDIARPFYLGQSEVTVAQWRAFAESTGYRSQAEKGKGATTPDGSGSMKPDASASWRNPFPKHKVELQDRAPASALSWDDASRFCEHYGLRLPTEAEWEYACRAGTTTSYWWGDPPEGAQGNANLSDKSAKQRFSVWDAYGLLNDGSVFSSPVDLFNPNPWGLHDMIGNVWEWCADAYLADAYKLAGRDGQKPAEGGTKRVARGGSWFNIPSLARCAARNGQPPETAYVHYGFRAAKTP